MVTNKVKQCIRFHHPSPIFDPFYPPVLSKLPSPLISQFSANVLCISSWSLGSSGVQQVGQIWNLAFLISFQPAGLRSCFSCLQAMKTEHSSQYKRSHFLFFLLTSSLLLFSQNGLSYGPLVLWPYGPMVQTHFYNELKMLFIRFLGI